LNNVYFDKRKLYLAGIIQSLQFPKIDSSNKKEKTKKKQKTLLTTSPNKYAISFLAFKGDSRKPILQIKHIDNNLFSNISVRVIPTVKYFIIIILLAIIFLIKNAIS
jgi:hypothetical protein